MPVLIPALLGFFILTNAVGAFAGTANAPLAPVSDAPHYTVSVTAYNAVPWQTDDDPSVTASGAASNPEVVAARSRDLAKELPFGTVVALSGPANPSGGCGFDLVEPLIGYRVIADTMNERFTDRVDVLFHSRGSVSVGGTPVNPARALGVCDGVTVRVVGRIDIAHMPRTQAELARMVEGGDAIAYTK